MTKKGIDWFNGKEEKKKHVVNWWRQLDVNAPGHGLVSIFSVFMIMIWVLYGIILSYIQESGQNKYVLKILKFERYDERKSEELFILNGEKR